MDVEKVKDLKVALVDDFLTVDGGAQKVLRVLHDMWRNPPVYALTYFPERFDPPLKGWDIRTSWVSKLPFSRELEQQYKIFYPSAIESLEISGFDLVISSTYAGYSKAVILPPETMHISWVHTVPRFLWGYRTSTHEQVNWIYKNVILPPLEHYWRIWDRQTSLRPDYFMANSQNIANRVKKFYRRDAKVLYPPVQIENLLKEKPDSGNYYIYFGRLEKYKCVDMAIRACVAAKEKLRIIGSGGYEEELKKLVIDLRGSNYVEFLGWMAPGAKMNREIARAKAFVFPGPDEDFGMVMVESLAAGTPVIAFDAGGAGEILENGKTGVLLGEFSQELLNQAVRNFDPSLYDPETCREQSRRFGEGAFRENLTKLITEVM